MSKKMKEGQCFLCLEQTSICDSHIIPKCMTKNIRKDHSRVYTVDDEYSGKLSIGQDTIKCYMLCKTCEGKFGKLETGFSKDVIKKSHDLNIKYSCKLYEFLLSVFWRIMEYRIITAQNGNKRYGKIFHLKERIRLFLHKNVKIEELEMYMFILDDRKTFDFKVLTGRRKINNITYSVYSRFVNGCSAKGIDCSKDSATNYSLSVKVPFSTEKFSFLYFDFFYDDGCEKLFVIAEKFIFCLNLSNKKLNFPECSRIKYDNGVWNNVQFPCVFNDYLNKYGNMVNLDCGCEDQAIFCMLYCLKKEGIISVVPH